MSFHQRLSLSYRVHWVAKGVYQTMSRYRFVLPVPPKVIL